MSETKKSLGQHWLNDPSMLRAIVAAGDVSELDTVLEIGPGKGTLTKVILDTGAEVHALEYDAELIQGLQDQFINCKKFVISWGDIREFDYSSLQKDYKIVANIPYYLTSNLIRAISETNNPPRTAVLLIQKEVAQRLCAEPGNMSILSVTAQFYFSCSLSIEVPARYFTPPPKVDSQVVVLQRRHEKLYDVDEQEFFKLIKAGFSEKRKTLRNSLSGGLQWPKEATEQLLAHASVSPTLRAQALSLDDWYTLYRAYELPRTTQ